jgi:DNA-binding IclR family transcriptional regulator
LALFSQPTARALAILDLLMANPGQAFGLTEMTRRLNLNKATCHAILTTMANYGFLVQHPRTKAYRLGPSIMAAGNAAFVEFPVLEYARPALEALGNESEMGFGVTGRTPKHLVLLALYGAAAPVGNFQLGLRLPNTGPIGAAFIAWSPAKSLEAWLTRAHESIGNYYEKLDQRLRMSVIGIRARGYEVTLKTKAESDLFTDLKEINNSWNLQSLEEVTHKYQAGLCNEHYHLDRIEPKVQYDVSTITVPVFAYKQMPALCFAAGIINNSISGSDIEDIANRLKQAAEEVIATARFDNEDI